MFFGMPTTRSKEVAKWRLSTAKEDDPPVPQELRHVFDQLWELFCEIAFDLLRGSMNDDDRVGFRNIHDIPQALESTIRREGRQQIGDMETTPSRSEMLRHACANRQVFEKCRPTTW